MKHRSGLKLFFTIAGFFLPIKLLMAAMVTPTNNTARIWVQYLPGKEESVRQILHCAGAVFHYDFNDLNSFVVTIPQQSIDNLSLYSDISDYWYTAMLTQDEPLELHVR